MAASPFISICIPCYKRAHLLRRLFHSIAAQTYKDFNVIVTDNSDDESVRHLVREYETIMPVTYHQNDPFLEMGANWNACMERADGTWLKLMHDDDWFTDEHCLAAFASKAAARKHGLIFSAYYNVQEGTEAKTLVLRKSIDLWLLNGSPYNLLRGNYIGPPSVTLIHRDTFRSFHPQLKWMVDVEEYLRVLKLRHGLTYIAAPLICIGVHEGQATTAYFRNPSVEVYENCVTLAPHYPRFCRNVFAYDHCWRLIRNLGIRDESVLERYNNGAEIPYVLRSITRCQKHLPASLLKMGILSKILMLGHWVFFNSYLLFKRNNLPVVSGQ